MRKQTLNGQVLRTYQYRTDFVISLACLLLSSSFVRGEALPATPLNPEQVSAIRRKIDLFCGKCLTEPIVSVRPTLRSQRHPSTQREEDAYLVNEKYGFGVDCQTGIITAYELSQKHEAQGFQDDKNAKTLADKEVFEKISPFLDAFGLPTAVSEYERTNSKIRIDTANYYHRYKYKGVLCLGCYAVVEVSLRTGTLLSIRSIPVFVPPAEPQEPLPPCDAVQATSTWIEECSETKKSKYKITMTVKDCKTLEKVIAPHQGLIDNKNGDVTDLAYCWVVPFELLEFYEDSGTWQGPWPCEAHVSCATGKVIGDSVGPPIQRDK